MELNEQIKENLDKMISLCFKENYSKEDVLILLQLFRVDLYQKLLKRSHK